MMTRVVCALLLAISLGGCGQNEPPKQRHQSIGGQLGESYKGMLDGARQGADQASDQMQRTERAVRDRD